MGAWSQTLDDATARRIAAIISNATELDGTAPVSEQVVHSLTRNSDAQHLVWSDNDVVAGYANLTPAHADHPAMAEVVVDPEYRGRRIGTELVTQALAAGGQAARVWAHGDLPAARALAERAGLTSARELLQMRRSLVTPELPELTIPADVRVRAYAGSTDDADILRINNAAFSWHPEQGGWTQADIDDRRAEAWFDPNGLIVAADSADRMIGFHWTKVHAATATEPAIGEVYVVAVDPAAQGRGLGRVLTLAGLQHLRSRELAEVLLYSEADNVAAVRTYEHLGFGVFHVDVAYTQASV